VDGVGKMEKDTQDQIPFWGFIVPAIILIVVLVNLVSGKVYWPASRAHPGQIVVVYADRYRFWGTILFEFGMAVGIFAWYGAANYSKTERAALPLLLNSIGIAIGGLILFSIGMFR
jgi:hypothetical protein